MGTGGIAHTGENGYTQRQHQCHFDHHKSHMAWPGIEKREKEQILKKEITEGRE
jgi:hypothetical protein